jgi:hypothetical protein
MSRTPETEITVLRPIHCSLIEQPGAVATPFVAELDWSTIHTSLMHTG